MSLLSSYRSAAVGTTERLCRRWRWRRRMRRQIVRKKIFERESVGSSDNPSVDPVHDQQTSSTPCIGSGSEPSLAPGVDPTPALFIFPFNVPSYGPSDSPFLGLDSTDLVFLPAQVQYQVSSLNT